MPTDPQSRELTCDICGRDHAVWSAPNDVWNAVCRWPDGSDKWPFLCPTCFMNEAEEKGLGSSWRLVPTDALEQANTELASLRAGLEEFVNLEWEPSPTRRGSTPRDTFIAVQRHLATLLDPSSSDTPAESPK